MDHMAQPHALDARDARRIDAVAAAEVEASRSLEPVTAEFGSGWYHDAEIAASARAPVQKH